MIAKKKKKEEEEENEEKNKYPQSFSQRQLSLFIPPSPHPLSTLVPLLQECVDDLHIGPHGLLSAFISVDAPLLLRRLRAIDILQRSKELEAWKVLWHLFFEETTGMNTHSNNNNMTGLKRGKGYSLPDGHGRLLAMSVSLLRQFVSPEAKYPVLNTLSATRNRRCLIRVLQQLITPDDLKELFPISIKDNNMIETHTDIISRITREALRDVQPYSHTISPTITRPVLEGCIHYTMCTEMEGDVLIILRRLLLSFLYNSPVPKGRIHTQSVIHRARALLMDPFSYITPCLGKNIRDSRVLPCGIFILPTTSSTLTVHEGTQTPFFILENCESEEEPFFVLLLRIDDKGGLLNFAHSKLEDNNNNNDDNDYYYDDDDDNEEEESEEWNKERKEGIRELQRTWTMSEQDEAQLEAARILYTWAWKHNVRVILTPSYVPPVVKTYGQRYNAEGVKICINNDNNNNGTDTVKNNPIFMVDEVDETLFDALLRRQQYWRHDRRENNNNNNNNEIFSSLDVAVLRRGKLELPECPSDALLPVERIIHHSVNSIFQSSIPHHVVRERDDNNNNTTVVLLELYKHKPYDVLLLQEKQNLEGMGSIFLVALNSNLISIYKALLLKTTASVLTALDTSSLFSGNINAECGFGFVRAGGALSIALARQLRRTAAEILKQKSCTTLNNNNNNNNKTVKVSAISHFNIPVMATVLQLLSEALLEVPRHLSTHITSHHYPLRRCWWDLEADEMRCDHTQMIQSLSLTAALKAPLHVCIREDPTYYRRGINALTQVKNVKEEYWDDKRKYFCCSDTESSCSSESESEKSFHQEEEEEEERNELNGISFVEPVAITTGILRAAIAFVRLILICEDSAGDVANI